MFSPEDEHFASWEQLLMLQVLFFSASFFTQPSIAWMEQNFIAPLTQYLAVRRQLATSQLILDKIPF